MLSDAQALALFKVVSDLRGFLETEPPFKRLSFELPEMVALVDVGDLAPKSISLPCPECQSRVTTWKRLDSEYRNKMEIDNPWEEHPLWRYRCSDCGKREALFWIAVRSTKNVKMVKDQTEATKAGSIEKVAQWPRWTPRIPKRVEKALGEKAELLLRGMHCLQDGYGIGAAAYLRRVVEDEARAIVELVREAAVLDNDEAAVQNADEALKQESARTRLELAAKRIPASLRVDGQNPLEVLYGNLSGPLHTETDEEGVEVATMLIDA